MNAYTRQSTTRALAVCAQPAESWLAGVVRAGGEAWCGYRNAASSAERRHQMTLFLLYLFAAFLPFGSLLLALRWLWLRHHL